MAKTDYVIEVTDLKKSYGKQEVLKGIDLRVERGTMLALLGPNGAGKTTTVRILSTLLPYNDGSITVNGVDLAEHPDKVRNTIGLTGQSAAIDELLTGRENLVMMGRLFRLTPASAKARAQELLEDFDLVDAANRPAKTYSGGMRRRLDLAVSLISAPPVIFLDEPTTGLDPRSRIAMWDIIRDLMSKGTTILLTTQYLEEADQLANKIALIDGGRVVAEGTPAELKRKVGNDRLILTTANTEDLAKVTAILGKDAIDANEKERNVTVTIHDLNTDVAATLTKISKKGIALESIDVHKPTLDDVFLSLTGKQHAAETDTDKEAK